MKVYKLNDIGEKILDKPPFIRQQGSRLAIDTATDNDVGSYQVSICSQVLSLINCRTFKVTVSSKPEIKVEPKEPVDPQDKEIPDYDIYVDSV